jgi:hypothetical protein
LNQACAGSAGDDGICTDTFVHAGTDTESDKFNANFFRIGLNDHFGGGAYGGGN